jgi:hypothetical protein
MAVKVKTWGLDRWDQRKEQPGFLWAGHSRDDTGRFRTLSDGETKALPRPHSVRNIETLKRRWAVFLEVSQNVAFDAMSMI